MDTILYHRPDRMKELLSADLTEELQALFGGAEFVPSALAESIRLFCETRNANVRVDRDKTASGLYLWCTDIGVVGCFCGGATSFRGLVRRRSGNDGGDQ